MCYLQCLVGSVHVVSADIGTEESSGSTGSSTDLPHVLTDLLDVSLILTVNCQL